jgi:chlorobactene glucosyltransferase
MSGVLDVFGSEGRLNKPLLLLFVLICSLLLLNALLHDPTSGYDAEDHLHYVQSLATNWRLPTKAETGQYYSPPLPYVLPAALTALHLGLWKALKMAQVFNALLAAGLLFYLLKICELVSPQNRRFKLLCLGMLGLLPVFYRSFALIRGEPYLAFLAVFIAHETLSIFLKRLCSLLHLLTFGVALGLSILARQWGFFLFPPVLILALWTRTKTDRWQASATALGALLISLLVGGWFYLQILRQYGTLMAFDRAPQQPTAVSASALLRLDASSFKLFADPVRPSLSGQLFPIFYADTWGDYWGYFLVYARNANTGDFEGGNFFQKVTAPGLVPPQISTNRFEINRYLGALNLLDLIPSALLVCGFIHGCRVLPRFLAGRAEGDSDRTIALFAMLAGASLLGFLWFLLRYQSAAQHGDLIKVTYLLQAFPALAVLAGSFIDRMWDRYPTQCRAIAGVLALIFIVEVPAFITHYVHLSATPAILGFLLSTTFFLAALLITFWIHTRYYLDIVVEPVPPPTAAPMISVCLPARDEAANIRACLEALLAQTYPNFEVIVLDDRSTDATPDILKEFSGDARLRVLQGAELPEGWAGKPHALVQAAAAASGDWMCFVDADTFLSREALASCYERAVATGADLFTIMTRQVTGTFWEKVVMPLVMTALSVGFPPREVNDPKSRAAVANGQFIMIKRSVYAALGGHARIMDQIVEDKALAELVKWNGYHLIVADGRLVARTRMYTSLPQMWEGWTKNIFLGLRAQPNLVFLGTFGALVLVVAALFLPVWPLLGVSWYLHDGGWMALAVIAEALVLWAVLLYLRAAVAHAIGIPRLYALTTPLGAGIFAAMMLTSAWKVISGQGVTWRGRRYNPSRKQPR